MIAEHESAGEDPSEIAAAFDLAIDDVGWALAYSAGARIRARLPVAKLAVADRARAVVRAREAGLGAGPPPAPTVNSPAAAARRILRQ